MKREECSYIPAECEYCKKPPIALMRVRVIPFFRMGFHYEKWTCKEHQDRVMKEGYDRFA